MVSKYTADEIYQYNSTVPGSCGEATSNRWNKLECKTNKIELFNEGNAGKGEALYGTQMAPGMPENHLKYLRNTFTLVIHHVEQKPEFLAASKKRMHQGIFYVILSF